MANQGSGFKLVFVSFGFLRACLAQVDDSACVLPFPSSFYLQPSSVSDTGLQVVFGPETLPQVGLSW